MKTKKQLLTYLKDELTASQKELQLISKKFPDTRKVKKNDMFYGEMVNRTILLADVIYWIKNLEDVK